MLEPAESAASTQLSFKSAAIVALAVIPAQIFARVLGILWESALSGFYQGAKHSPDWKYFFLVDSVGSAATSFIFVWLCSMAQKQIRWISVWVLFGFTVLFDASLASVGSMSEQAVWGHSVGSLLAALIFFRKTK